MRRLIPTLGVLAAVALAACSGGDGNTAPGPVLAQSSGAGDAALGISVVGRGEVRAAPDALELEIGVSATRASVAEATAAAAQGARGIIDALVAGGVAEEEIQTRHLSVRPEREHRTEVGPRVVGYTATNTVVAVIRDLDAAGAIIDAAIVAGGDDAVLDGVRFRLDDDAEAVVEARAAAFADARARAEQLAELAGVPLGSALAIEERLSGDPVVLPVLGRLAEDAATPIARGEVTTTVAVAVRFAIG